MYYNGGNKMSKKNFYYGTSNLDLDVKVAIDPNYPSLKKFEFGNGFYLSPYKNVATDYARDGILIDYLKSKSLNDEKIIKDLISGDIFKANIHTYEIDLDVVSKSIRLCNNIDQYEVILKETIEGYRTNENYSPKEQCTYGRLCGKYWDDNVDASLLKSGFEKECKENMMTIVDDNGKEVPAEQLCLHHNKECIKGHKYNTITGEIY